MKLTALEFIVAAFAVFRIALFVAKEEGPWSAGKKIRAIPDKGTNARRGLSCPWCVSIYGSIVVTFFLVCGQRVDGWWALPVMLALSTAAIIINQQWTQDKESK